MSKLKLYQVTATNHTLKYEYSHYANMHICDKLFDSLEEAQEFAKKYVKDFVESHNKSIYQIGGDYIIGFTDEYFNDHREELIKEGYSEDGIYREMLFNCMIYDPEDSSYKQKKSISKPNITEQQHSNKVVCGKDIPIHILYGTKDTVLEGEF